MRKSGGPSAADAALPAGPVLDLSSGPADAASARERSAGDDPDPRSAGAGSFRHSQHHSIRRADCPVPLSPVRHRPLRGKPVQCSLRDRSRIRPDPLPSARLMRKPSTPMPCESSPLLRSSSRSFFNMSSTASVMSFFRRAGITPQTTGSLWPASPFGIAKSSASAISIAASSRAASHPSITGCP